MTNAQTIEYKGGNIRFLVQGKNEFPVVLLHGYLEALDIWGDFATELAKKCQVISIDLPGHGETDTFNGSATIEQMGETVKVVLDELNIDKAVIIGHSMGGYAMLAFYEENPDRVLGMGFFHSVSWADTDEKRANRDREIELVKQGKQNLIFNTNIPKGFADDNLKPFYKEVEHARQIALQMDDESIIAVLEGMKARKDYTYLVEQTKVPLLFVVGLKDNYIPSDKLLALAAKAPKSQVVILENSGHMGFIEEKELAFDEVEDFLSTVFKE
jgi:pimeloyl-ACP methyl ester carboxylesterase